MAKHVFDETVGKFQGIFCCHCGLSKETGNHTQIVELLDIFEQEAWSG